MGWRDDQLQHDGTKMRQSGLSFSQGKFSVQETVTCVKNGKEHTSQDDLIQYIQRKLGYLVSEFKAVSSLTLMYVVAKRPAGRITGRSKRIEK